MDNGMIFTGMRLSRGMSWMAVAGVLLGIESWMVLDTARRIHRTTIARVTLFKGGFWMVLDTARWIHRTTIAQSHVVQGRVLDGAGHSKMDPQKS